MSFMKPDEVIKMYEKYVLPPYKKELEQKGQGLTLNLEDDSEDMNLAKEMGQLLHNKMDRTFIKDTLEMTLENEETRGFVQRLILTLFNTAKEYKKDPNLEDQFKRDAELLLSKDPKERLEGVKNIFETINNLLPNFLKLKGDRYTTALRFVLDTFNKHQPKEPFSDEDMQKHIDELSTSKLIGEKEKTNAPTPKPSSSKKPDEKEQMLVSESGDFIQKLGFPSDPQAKGITTVTELLTQPLSPQLQTDLREELSNCIKDPSMNYTRE